MRFPLIGATKQRIRLAVVGEEKYRSNFIATHLCFSTCLMRLWSLVPSGGTLPEEVWRQRHQFLLRLAWFHVIVIALVGPAAGYRWEWSLDALFHEGTVLHALGEGLIVGCFTALAYLRGLNRAYQATAVAFALMTASAILVHLSGGYIELHFHFFVMLAFMALYQDWIPYLLAILYVAIHHGVVGILWPEEVYNHTAALEAPWTWAAIHAFFILCASVGSAIAWRFNEKGTAQTRMILNSAGEGIYGLDREGTVTFVNPAAARMLGLEEKNIVGKKMLEVVRHTKGDGSPFSAATPILAPLNDGAAGHAADELFWRRDGRSFPVDYTSTPILERGQLTGAVVTFRDVTERREAEKALRESEYRFHQITENINEVFWITDPVNNEFLYISPGYREIWGRSPERLAPLARSWLGSIHPGDLGRVLAAVVTKQVSGGYDEEYRIVRPDGSIRWIRDRAFPVGNQRGKIYRITGVAEDITERKKAAEELSALYAFLGPISQTKDLTKGLDDAVVKIMEVTGAEAASIRLSDEGGDRLLLISHRGFPETYTREIASAFKGKVVEDVLKTGEPLISEELSGDARFDRGLLAKNGFRSAAYLPLKSSHKVHGLMVLASRNPDYFRKNQTNYLMAIARQMGIALENRDLFDELRTSKDNLEKTAEDLKRQREIQKLLKELSQNITSLDNETLFKKLTERVREFFGVDVCDVRMMRDWRPMGVSGVEPERIRGTGSKRGRSKWILEHRKPLAIADVTKETEIQTGETTQRIGLRGYLAVPLFSRDGEVIGILRALTYQPREFTQEEIDLLQQLANGAAIALENARLFQETERRAQEQAVLNAIAMAASQSLDLKELLQTALDKVLEVTGRERGYIRLKDSVTGELTLSAHRGISEEYVKILLYQRTPGGKSDQVFKSGEPLVINDPEGTLLREETRKEGNSSIAWIPLKAKEKVVGILNVSTSRPVPFTLREVELLQAIGNVIGVALENARLFEETKLNEEYLLRTRDHLENIFNSLDREMFWSSDPRSEILLYLSQGTENIYGISREAFSTSPSFWKQIVHPEDTAIVEEIEQEIQAGKKVKREYRIIRPKTAEVRWVQTRIIPVTDESGKVTRIDGLLIDVTDAKQVEEALAQKAEELARSNTELQHFAYIASHDLQEPLRMVAGYTQLLAKRYKDKLDSDAREFIDFAVDGVVRMQALINALLAYSRIGTKGKEFEPTDLKDVLDYTLTNLRAAIQESGAVVTHDSLPTVMADSTQLGQLLQNLIGNAIKFRGKEPPHIHIASQQKGQEWLFSVKDNGIGIDPQYAERIFIIFQRLHNKQEYPGTGIGLALCKKIVERHGGRMWVESQPGEGAAFCFTLPM